MAAIKIAAAGVGNPINEVVCLVSILKLASLKAENKGISKAKKAGEKLRSAVVKNKVPVCKK